MCCEQQIAQFDQAGLIGFVNDQLIRIGASIRPHRHGFHAANQFRATLAKPPPTPAHGIRHPAIGRAIPTLHRVQRNPVAEGFAVHSERRQRLADGGIVPCDFILTGNLDSQGRHVRAKRVHRLQRWNARQLERSTHAAGICSTICRRMSRSLSGRPGDCGCV